ncbi:MAG: cytochrome C oxidase subunit IV family protein [Moheibacter sp.]
MEKNLNITYVTLLVLTALTAVVSTLNLYVGIILIIALLKFWLVAFSFMELKKAHVFWKILIILYGSIIGTILIFLI